MVDIPVSYVSLPPQKKGSLKGPSDCPHPAKSKAKTVIPRVSTSPKLPFFGGDPSALQRNHCKAWNGSKLKVGVTSLNCWLSFDMFFVCLFVCFLFFDVGEIDVAWCFKASCFVWQG